VQALTSADWQGDLKFDRVTVDEASLIDLSGISWDGTAATPYFSLAPGHVFRHYGSVEVVDRLMLTASQSDTNTLAGLYSAMRNNPYPKIDVKLASNHRLFDIAPYQRMTLAIAAADTPRGITEALTLIPRNITYQFGDGVMLTDATFEAEVTAALAVTGDTPIDPPTPPIEPIEPPIIPPIDPPPDTDAYEVWFATEDAIYWSGDYFNGGQPAWNKVAGAMPTTYWPSGGQFYALTNGAAIYLNNYRDVYECRNPKAASPTWTHLFTAGDVVAGYTSSPDILINIYGGTLCLGVTITGWTAAGGVYGEYSGGSITWYGPFRDMSFNGGANGSTVVGVSYNSLVLTTPDGPQETFRSGWDRYGNSLHGMPPGTTLAYSNKSTWLSEIDAKVWVFVWNRWGDNTTGWRHLDGVDGGKPWTGDVNRTIVLTGAWRGAYYYTVSEAGHLYISTDGSTYTDTATWLQGTIWDVKYLGGGSLFWIPKTVLASTVLSRLYSPAGAIVPDVDGNGDRTGDFWTMTGHATGNQLILGSGLVYA
jgi:hypothetical protein